MKDPTTTPVLRRQIYKDALLLHVGRSFQVLVNALTFILLARVLGATEFGRFSTVVAILSPSLAIADLGLGQLAMKAVAQDNAREVALVRRSIPIVYVACSGMLAVDCILAALLLRHSWSAVAAAAMLGVSYLHMQAQVNIQRGLWLGALSFPRAIIIEVITASIRLLGLAVVLAFNWTSLIGVSAGIALSGVFTLAVVQSCLAYQFSGFEPRFSWREVAGEGAPFPLTALSWNSFVELPKLILAGVSTSAAVGFFSAAYRVFSIALVPLQAALNAFTPRLFAAATKRGGVPLLRALGENLLLAASLAGVLMLGAPLLPIVLGAQYAPATSVLPVLALSLPAQALVSVAGDWLGGSGRQRHRLFVTGATLLIGIPVNMVAAQQKGPVGSAAAYSAMTAVLALASILLASRVPTSE